MAPFTIFLIHIALNSITCEGLDRSGGQNIEAKPRYGPELPYSSAL